MKLEKILSEEEPEDDDGFERRFNSTDRHPHSFSNLNHEKHIVNNQMITWKEEKLKSARLHETYGEGHWPENCVKVVDEKAEAIFNE